MKSLRVKVKEVPKRLGDIATLVCSQENACRFCYGIARTQMKLFGYSDKMISGIEQDMLMAELDVKDRTFIRFCRNLARSNPRPPKAEKAKLIELGFTENQVIEMAFHIARECFVNRVITFISSPPMFGFERLPTSFMGRLMRPLIARKIRLMAWHTEETMQIQQGPFSEVMKTLSVVPEASVFQEGIIGAMRSTVLSEELKVLMIGVVARSLSCEFCYGAASSMARNIGFTDEEFQDALTMLTTPRLNEQEQKILLWTRETVHYQTDAIQRRLKTLAEEVDHLLLLEAIGLASLANSVVRLGILLE